MRLERLPAPVKKYLEYTRTILHPPIAHFRAAYRGKIRKDKNSRWMPFVSDQYGFVRDPSRFFFMRASLHHLPITGFHSFFEGHAIMDIRLLSLIRVEYQQSIQLDISETVTWLSELCVQLVNFISEDRYYTTKDHQLVKMPWSTPVSDYKEFNGYLLPSFARLTWSLPDGEFCYGEFHLQSIAYNTK